MKEDTSAASCAPPAPPVSQAPRVRAACAATACALAHGARDPSQVERGSSSVCVAARCELVRAPEGYTGAPVRVRRRPRPSRPSRRRGAGGKRSAPRAARRGVTQNEADFCTLELLRTFAPSFDFAKDAAPRGHSACVVCSAHAAPREVDHARGWRSPANRASMHALERPIGSPVSDSPIEGVPFRCVGAFGSRRGQAACGCGEAPMTVKC